MQVMLRGSLVFILLVLLLASCTSTKEVGQQDSTKADNRYDSEFPNESISKELDFVSETVKKLDCLAFYMSYVFPPGNNIEVNNITDTDIELYSKGSTVTNESVTGTATVIYYDGGRVGLLTCAHVINFPDTIIVRYNDGTGPVEILSVKVRQQNYVKDLPEGEDVEIIVVDNDNDIAILMKKLDEHVQRPVVLNYPVGNTKDLEWGSIVYVMGFPLGNLMVTRGLVSNPKKAGRGRFLTDALYNRGISGSPVLAIRDGVPNFEWVGIASSAAAQNLYYVKPGKENPEFINPEQEYNGELYVDYKKSINYGVTYNITIETITGFINKQKPLLAEKGFDVERFFK